MKELRISQSEITTTEIPEIYKHNNWLFWELTINKKLKDIGFDLEKFISRYDDIKTNDMIFLQGD